MSATMRAWLPARFLLLALPLLAAAQPVPPAPPGTPNPHASGMPTTPPAAASPHGKDAPSPWAGLADYTITVTVPPKGASGTWKFRTFADPADVVVELDTPAPGGRTRGTMVMVGGQAIAVKGFTPEKGFEIDPLDGALVNFKMLVQLLDAAMPGGPAEVKGRKSVKAGEGKASLVASTPTANARFNAPWTVKGTLERIDAKSLAFRLEVEAPLGDKPGERGRWTYTGRASGTATDRKLEDEMGLAGFAAYSLAPQGAKHTHTTLKFGVTKLEAPFATVRDLRAFLAQPVATK
jgi:hypothetical protein